jgi:uncharacterized protein (TIRG00374 family)
VRGRVHARLLEIFFVSTFVGTFLPASIGGDAVRAYSLSRENVSGADAVASVFMDRNARVASLLLMGVAGLFLAQDLASKQEHPDVTLSVTTAVSVLTMLMIFSERDGQSGVSAVAGGMPIPRGSTSGRAASSESVRRYASHHDRAADR